MTNYGRFLNHVMFTAMVAATGSLQAAVGGPYTSIKMYDSFGISQPVRPASGTVPAANIHYGYANTDRNGNARSAWYPQWKTPTPGVFAFEVLVDNAFDDFTTTPPKYHLSEICPGFSKAMFPDPTEPQATRTLSHFAALYPLVNSNNALNTTARLIFGGWGYCSSRMDVTCKPGPWASDGPNINRGRPGSVTQADIDACYAGTGPSAIGALGGATGAYARYYESTPGFVRPAASYRLLFDFPAKTFSVAIKKPSEPYSAYVEVLSQADYPMTDANSPFSKLSTAPADALQYFSLTAFVPTLMRNIRLLNPHFVEPTTAMPASFTNDCNPTFFVGNELAAPGVGAFEFTVNPQQDAQDMYNALITLVPSLDDAEIQADNALPANQPNGPFKNSFTISLGDPSKNTFYTRNGWTGTNVACSTSASNCFATTGSASVPLRIRIEINQYTKSLVIKTKPVAATDSASISNGSAFTTTIFNSANLPAGSNTLFDGLKGKGLYFALYSAFGPNTYTNVCSGTLGGTTAVAGYTAVPNLAFHSNAGVAVGATSVYMVSEDQSLVMQLKNGALNPFGTLPADAGNLTYITANDTELYVCSDSGRAYRAAMSDGVFTRVAALNSKNIAQICSGAPGQFLALDNAGTLWLQSAIGSNMRPVPASGSVQQIAVSRGASPTMFALLTDGSVLMGTTTLTAMPMMAGTTPLKLRSIAACSTTNVMGVTTSGNVARFSAPTAPAGAPATWALLNAAGTTPSPASGFRTVCMGAAPDKAALISFDDDLYMNTNTDTKSGSTKTGTTGTGVGNQSSASSSSSKKKTRTKTPKKPASKPAATSTGTSNTGH